MYPTLQYLKLNLAIAPGVAHIQLNRPDVLNALCLELMAELRDTLKLLDADGSVRCIVLSGDEKAFAAGADIKQMAGKSAIDMQKIDQFTTWDQIKKTKKPIIGAVSGFALGGGCELAMHCDMLVASETAKFGQPEIKIGTMPGAGGTQRLTRAVGKALAMEMVLTGRFISAHEALAAQLINRVVPIELYLAEAVKLASQIAELSPVAVQLAKESVLQAFNSTLDEGLLFERKNFYLTFASNDQKEGMAAFVEKRKPNFSGN
ncbi:MAG: enoyl-CoA hydratase/isomerase family protein [Sphingobacteriales bacterium]|jgi:enoyl-CoA hydratase|nr:enoyl-CoA hydratase/isomerase family protein [Sphingobacteriales bacterium]MBP9142793.1 enoyl-CoA hydratase/isomerase family protein [Chitinophagales bacterium]MDA0199892.1 enoyl-CoA hydratase-related protein [Bacteroidota bacterium]MBK7528776.1 enoyl-CoA hydratase/isomerase family protein [Sphingobacteriales bacterium]MBK8679250.1 enoyl-CoA hydratase/isomerase family protein [Sphingobacteriales bacterium]